MGPFSVGVFDLPSFGLGWDYLIGKVGFSGLCILFVLYYPYESITFVSLFVAEMEEALTDEMIREEMIEKLPVTTVVGKDGKGKICVNKGHSV